jgi:hypothetical protein
MDALTPAEENSLRWINFCELMKPWLENAKTDDYTKDNVIAKVQGTIAMMEES